MRGRGGLLLLLTAACATARHPPPVPPPPPAAPLASGVDVHAHVTMGQALPLFSGEPGRPPLAARPSDLLVNQLDAPGLRRAGVRMLVAALWPPWATRPGRGALDEAVHQLDALRAFARRSGDFQVARSAAELRALSARGLVAMLPGIEGGEGIRRVEDVDVLFAAGARSLTLTHFSDNALADAADGQFGPLVARVLDGRDGGLTPLGRDVVRRMVQLGMVVDVAHGSARTVEDVLALVEPLGVPVLASHEGAGWKEVHTQTDAHARRIGALGGLVGAGVYRHAVLRPVPEEERWAGFQPGTCDETVAHWLHWARLAGEGAVVLGSDLSAPILRPAPGGLCPTGLRHAGDLPELFAALEARGYPRARLDDMGERFLRFLERVEAHADPEARAAALRTPFPRPDVLDVPL